jgi:hypothetical protein
VPVTLLNRKHVVGHPDQPDAEPASGTLQTPAGFAIVITE